MARTARWKEGTFDKGIIQVKLSSWKYFSDYINQEMLDYTTYIYRGHANSEWKLEPAIDRIIKSPKSARRDEHLLKFQFETRGRRGSNPPNLTNDNDWWALGQHHGLVTPLLDWTESPFVALYFAAASAYREKKKSNIAVFAFSQASVGYISLLINNNDNVQLINDRKPTVKIVKPLSDENSRLVSQRGLFTRGPNNMDIEEWVKKFNYDDTRNLALIKIVIPTTGMQECLRYLNRMNINHSTLFPDLTGASEFCNKHLVVPKY